MLLGSLLKSSFPTIVEMVGKVFLSSKDEKNIKVGKAINEISSLPKEREIKDAIKSMDYKSLSSINKTIRKELESNDKFVRRMRPTFGYVTAFTWFLQMLVISYLMVFETPNAIKIISSIGELTVMWSAALSVLGVYVYKRSSEKDKFF